MRGLAVLTVAFVFASTTLFAGSASAQSGLALEGTVCTAAPSGYYPMPMDSGSGASAPTCSSGVGLPGATVRLSRGGTLPTGPAPVGPTSASATTDANGNYRVTGLEAGDYAYSVTRAGFEDAAGTVTVKEGARKDAALVGKSVEVAGKVVDAVTGAALAQAQAYFCCGMAERTDAVTGADGRFALTLQAGAWDVSLNAPGHQSAYRSRLLVDGTALTLAMDPVPPQDARIAGTVRDQDGDPVAGAQVTVSSYGSCCVAYATEGGVASSEPSRPYYGGSNSTTTDAEGRYTIGTYPGSNGLSVYKEGYAVASLQVEAQPGQTATQDVELKAFPAKTARIEGRIVDARTGKGLPNAYISVQSPEFGASACSRRASEGGGSSGSSGSSTWSDPSGSPDKAAMSIAPGEPYPNECEIVVEDDGRFSGLVTPGYAIVTVYVDWWSSCSETTDADGSFRRECGPEYYGWSLSRSLAADEATPLDVRMRSRPAPDAEVSGYVVDAKSGQAIAGAQVSFSNQDTYGYGTATTDGDGSYRIRLRSGFHEVHVWAPGHLRWQGTVEIAKGDTPFDVEVVPGEESYGGCCYGGPYPMMAEDAKAMPASGSSASGAATASASPDGDAGDERSSSQQADYVDLGGGLGPYDASKRADEIEEAPDGAPGLGLLAALAALGAVLLLRRRR